ncbi:MAG: RNA polymerase subunit sigma-70, partial [Chloroflexi bacterium]
MITPGTEDCEELGWLAGFHAGQRAVLEECYREHFSTVEAVVGRFLPGADKETVVHEVFYRVFAKAQVRKRFKGGSLGAWLSTVARNQAIDYIRRYKRETLTDSERMANRADPGSGQWEERLQAKLVIERFCRDHLPKKWLKVFEARFMRQLSQREVARELGLPRTTVAYQEHCIRSRLRRFL